MQLLHVSLITHRKLPCPLSFYSKDPIPSGSIVEVSVRKEKLIGIVIDSSELAESKGDIRTSSFQLKKVSTQSVVGAIDPSILKAYTTTAERLGVPYSLLFDALIPDHLRSNPKNITHILTTRYAIPEKVNISFLESSSEERIPEYKSIVRDMLARRTSIHIIAPTVDRVERLASLIGKGISHKLFVLHGEIAKKKNIQAIETICSTEEAIIICSTPHFGLITAKTTQLTIVDQESHPSYYSFDTPRFDYVQAYKYLWQHTNNKVIFADTILRIESYKDLEEKKASREFSIHSRFSHQIPVTFLTHQKDASFSAITETLLESLKKIRNGQHAFLYVARKGIHTSLQCSDCGTIVSCSSCGKPTSTQDTAQGRFLRCLYCNTKHPLTTDQDIICSTCGGWKIKGYGITTGGVFAELQEKIPHKEIYVVDKDLSEKQFQKTIQTWKTTGGILIGTDSAIPYIDQKLSLAAIVSCDAWLAVPDIDVHRRIIQVLEPLLEHSTNPVYVQTRLPEEPVFDLCKKENITHYIKQELKERLELQHTPYTTFVVLRKEKSFSKEEADRVCDMFPSAKPTIYKVHTDIRVLLRIKNERYLEDRDMHNKLQSLFPYIIVEVNPPTLFSR